MITSTGNSQIKNVINLEGKSKDRKAQGLFVVEGRKMFFETPRNRIHKAYATQDFFGEYREYFDGIDYELVSDEVFRHMSDTKTPQGVLLLVRMKECTVDSMIEDMESPLLLLLDNLQDPGNLGTLVRTAEGAGVNGIIMSEGTVDIYNPKVIRSTMGSLFRMKFCYVKNLPQVIERLRSDGVDTYGGDLSGAVEYTEPDYTRGTAFVIGNEGNGISDEVKMSVSKRIFIPMSGQLESLNAAVSGAICMYEAARQRRG